MAHFDIERERVQDELHRAVDALRARADLPMQEYQPRLRRWHDEAHQALAHLNKRISQLAAELRVCRATPKSDCSSLEATLERARALAADLRQALQALDVAERQFHEANARVAQAIEHLGVGGDQLDHMTDRIEVIESEMEAVGAPQARSPINSRAELELEGERFELMPLDWVEDPGLSQDDFEKVPYSDMAEAASKLPEVTSAVRAGSSRDELEARGYRTITDSYFSRFEPVHLDWDGSHFDPVSGRHRIQVAKDIGLREIPVSLSDGARAEWRRRLGF